MLFSQYKIENYFPKIATLNTAIECVKLKRKLLDLTANFYQPALVTCNVYQQLLFKSLTHVKRPLEPLHINKRVFIVN